MIRISEVAAAQIHNLLKEEGLSDSFLRVRVKPGGCSGLSYKMEFQKNADDQDQIFEEHQVKILIDPKSYMYIAGMTLDYSGGLNGSGFSFQNPNASKTCGCGSSFAV